MIPEVENATRASLGTVLDCIGHSTLVIDPQLVAMLNRIAGFAYLRVIFSFDDLIVRSTALGKYSSLGWTWMGFPVYSMGVCSDLNSGMSLLRV